MNAVVNIILGVVSGGALTAFITSYFQRRRMEAEKSKILAEAKKVAEEGKSINVNATIGLSDHALRTMQTVLDTVQKELQDTTSKLSSLKKDYDTLRVQHNELMNKYIKLKEHCDERERFYKEENQVLMETIDTYKKKLNNIKKL